MKAYNGGVRFQNGDTLIARITPCLENGKAAYINILNDKEVAFGSTEYIVFSPVDTMPSSFYYFLIRSKKFRTFALQYMNGSSGRQRVSGDELAAFPLTKPSHEALSRYDLHGFHPYVFLFILILLYPLAKHHDVNRETRKNTYKAVRMWSETLSTALCCQ